MADVPTTTSKKDQVGSQAPATPAKLVVSHPSLPNSSPGPCACTVGTASPSPTKPSPSQAEAEKHGIDKAKDDVIGSEWTAYAHICSGRMARLYYTRQQQQAQRRQARQQSQETQREATREASRSRTRESVERSGDIVRRNIEMLYHMQNERFLHTKPHERSGGEQRKPSPAAVLPHASPSLSPSSLPTGAVSPDKTNEVFRSRAARLAAMEAEFALLAPRDQVKLLHTMTELGLLHCLPPTKKAASAARERQEVSETQTKTESTDVAGEGASSSGAAGTP